MQAGLIYGCWEVALNKTQAEHNLQPTTNIIKNYFYLGDHSFLNFLNQACIGVMDLLQSKGVGKCSVSKMV